MTSGVGIVDEFVNGTAVPSHTGVAENSGFGNGCTIAFCVIVSLHPLLEVAIKITEKVAAVANV